MTEPAALDEASATLGHVGKQRAPAEDSSAPVVVFGGTGHYGRETVRALLARGAAVRVLSRSAARAGALLGEDVEIVEGDVRDRASIDSALDGARAAVVSIAAMTPKGARHLHEIEHDAVLRIFERAQDRGPSRVVYLSGYEIREDLLERHGISDEFGPKAEVERSLAATDLDWTILGHPPSMQLFFEMIRGDTLNVPGGGPDAIPTIAATDAGQITAQAALRDDLGGQRFHLTGPEAISFPDAAERIGAVLGRTIRYRAIPLLPLRIGMSIAGLFNPFYRYLWASVVLLNAFPQELAASVPEAHRRLIETFDLDPTTLEAETRSRVEAGLLR